MPLSSNGLCEARDHDAGVVAQRARQVGDGRRRDDAGARDRRALRRATPCAELALDPLAGLAGVAADQERSGAAASRRQSRRSARTSAAPSRATVADRADTRRPCRARRRCRTDGHCIEAERTVVRLGSSRLPDRHRRRRRFDATDARSSPPGRPGPADCTGRLRGRQGRRRRRTASRRTARSAASRRAAHGHAHHRRRHLRAQIGAEIPPAHRHAWAAALDRRRRDLDGHGRRLRLHAGAPTRRGRRRSRMSRTRVRAPSTDTGSVVASVTLHARSRARRSPRSPALTMTRPTTKPGAGSPSSAGTTGTVRLVPSARSSSASVDGMTCATSTPNGARTSSLRM